MEKVKGSMEALSFIQLTEDMAGLDIHSKIILRNKGIRRADEYETSACFVRRDGEPRRIGCSQTLQTKEQLHVPGKF